jgi:type IV pilus assembly protein PilM
VPGHSAFARFAKLPPVEPKKIPDIVKFEAVQQIPFPIDQVEWDYQTFMSPDSPDVEVGIFAITRERIMERLTVYEDVGIVPDYVTLSPVAAYNAMAYDLAFTEKTPGTILLDIGTTSTDLIIAEAGRVWIRTFPIGGHHFTEALVNSFQLSYPKAEKLKREAESSKHARHIFQAMRPVFSDLAQDVQRSIGYYQSLHKDAKLERLIGLGSTFRLPGLRKYLKQQLQLDVFRMEQFKRIGVDGPRAGEFQAQTLNMATAYGLSLQGLGMAALEANLMPVGVIRGAMWKRKARWFGAAAAVAVAAGGVMFIRPFLDDQAVSNNPPDRVIGDTIAEGTRLKQEAADATNPQLTSNSASDVLALLDARDVIPRIDADMREMLGSAQGSAPDKTKPVFAVKDFRTSYLSPSAGIDASGAPTPPPAPTGDTGAAAPPNNGKVHVTMTVTTTQQDALRFGVNTLEKWLRDHAKRDGVPYLISVEVNPVKETGRKTVDATLGAPGADTTGGRVLGEGSFQVGAGGGKGGPPMRTDVIRTGGDEAPRGMSGPGSSTPPDQKTAAAMDALRHMAPLPAPPPPVAGTTTTTLTVSWDALLIPKAGTPGGAS